MTNEQRVEVAIRCALAMEPTDEYRAWAERWLSGEDRTEKSAWEAAWAEAWAADAPAAAWTASRAAENAIDIARNAGIDVDAIIAKVEGEA